VTEKIKFVVGGAESFREVLASEWGMGDVEAASIVRQGHSPSFASAMIGIGVLKLFTPKKAKELPRKFVLAATPDRVVAFRAGSHSRGEGPSDEMVVTIHPGEIADWPRGSVSMRPDEGGMNQNATLVLAGNEVPCAVPDGDAEDSFRELIAKLGGSPGA
jgi:hypothetical protein